MAFKTKAGRASPDVDLTPMIDCVFNLLIFFMVINTMASIIGVKIDLPSEANSASAPSESLEVEIYHDTLRIDPELGPRIDRKGILRVNGVATNLDNLSDRLTDVILHMADKQDTLSIKADAETTHGTVVEVMDHAQDAYIDPEQKTHLRKFSFAEPTD